VDALLGSSLVKYQQNSYAGSVSDGLAGLSISGNWTFRYDATVSWKDVRLVIAYCYYLQGSYILCSGQLDLVDVANAPHTTNPLLLLDIILSLWGTV
jgi:hypothetical protein